MKKFIAAATIALTASIALDGAMAQTKGFAGSYLAAQQADAQNDFSAASDYYVRALGRDPSNGPLMEAAINALVNTGRLDRAVPIARRLSGIAPDSQIAAQVLMAHLVVNEEYDDVLSDISEGLSVGPLVDGLTSAWANVGAGNMSAALDAFDGVSERPGLAAFATYHHALALATVGDFEGAEALFTGVNGPQLQQTRRGVLAQAQILSQLERNEDAITAIRGAFLPGTDPEMDWLVTQLEAGDTLPFTLVTNATDGVAEVYHSVAAALNGEASDTFTLLYARTADYLRAGDTDTTIMMAGLLEDLHQYELAIEAYDQVIPEDPSYHAAVLGKAEAMRRADRSEDAIDALEDLIQTHGQIALVHQTLGDTLRRLERYDDASKAYDDAIALHGDPEARHWILYFARGITHEREDRWPLAEADFRQALALSPGQPQVLNYLGYSMVELRQNLDEALELIEAAVEARPDDGYITDSLGWVLYRLGRYDEAVIHMERAAELTPVDPIINDHLGDVYWAVGRELEARFQWRRALSFDPEEEDLARIRRKLEVGLDVVLEEEGAEPLDVAKDG